MKTKTAGFYFAAALCLASLNSCNTATAEGQTNPVKETAKKTEKQWQDDEWLDELKGKTPLSYEALEALLPKTLKGMPLVKMQDDSKNGRSGIKATYSMVEEPDLKTRQLQLFYMDGAGEAGYKHLKGTHAMLKLPMDKEEEVKILKVYERNNQRILIRQRMVKEIMVSEMEAIKDYRYHIKMIARDFPVNDLYEALDDIEKLEFPK